MTSQGDLVHDNQRSLIKSVRYFQTELAAISRRPKCWCTLWRRQQSHEYFSQQQTLARRCSFFNSSAGVSISLEGTSFNLAQSLDYNSIYCKPLQGAFASFVGLGTSGETQFCRSHESRRRLSCKDGLPP